MSAQPENPSANVLTAFELSLIEFDDLYQKLAQ
jgi:hypothetical protein